MKLNLTQASEIEGAPSLSTLKRHKAKGKFTVENDEKGDPVIDLSELARAYNITIDKETGDPVKKNSVNHDEPGNKPTEPDQNKGELAQDRLQIELEFEREQKRFYKQQLDKVEEDRDHWRDQAERLAITHQAVTTQHTQQENETTPQQVTDHIPSKGQNIFKPWLLVILLLIVMVITVIVTMNHADAMVTWMKDMSNQITNNDLNGL